MLSCWVLLGWLCLLLTYTCWHDDAPWKSIAPSSWVSGCCMRKRKSLCNAPLVQQAIQNGTGLSSLYRSVYTLTHKTAQMPVRYVGMFTDGGAAEALQQSAVDNM